MGVEVVEIEDDVLEVCVRPDGRALRDCRPACLRRGAIDCALGSATVRLGQSIFVAGVQACVTEVLPEIPTRGHVEVTVELPPLCSSLFKERNRSAAQCHFLSQTLTDVLNHTSVIDTQQLDIQAGESFWVLKVQIVCLNFDGNAFDACMLAALAALEDTQLPTLVPGHSVPEAQGATHLVMAAMETSSSAVTRRRRLTLRSRPLPASFVRLHTGEWAADPCSAEEDSGGSVCLCFVSGRWLVFHQGGGASKDQFMKDLMPAARSMVASFTELLNAEVEQ